MVCIVEHFFKNILTELRGAHGWTGDYYYLLSDLPETLSSYVKTHSKKLLFLHFWNLDFRKIDFFCLLE